MARWMVTMKKNHLVSVWALTVMAMAFVFAACPQTNEENEGDGLKFEHAELEIDTFMDYFYHSGYTLMSYNCDEENTDVVIMVYSRA